MMLKRAMKSKEVTIWRKKGCMDFLKDNKLTIDVLVTDRHKQINKWLREKHPDIKHYFDTWHVAKGSYIYT